jgi:hypothetical protein
MKRRSHLSEDYQRHFAEYCAQTHGPDRHGPHAHTRVLPRQYLCDAVQTHAVWGRRTDRGSPHAAHEDDSEDDSEDGYQEESDGQYGWKGAGCFLCCCFTCVFKDWLHLLLFCVSLPILVFGAYNMYVMFLADAVYIGHGMAASLLTAIDVGITAARLVFFVLARVAWGQAAALLHWLLSFMGRLLLGIARAIVVLLLRCMWIL